jgi:glycosyltransferase involved in cell wall biosynthesis
LTADLRPATAAVAQKVRAPPLALIAPIHPLVSGAAQFNTAMLSALRERGPVTALSWRRLYPPLVHRRDPSDLRSRPARTEQSEALLDWADPRTWHAARRIVADCGARAMVLPWVHPVMAPQYRYLLRSPPSRVRRVVICHNVLPHEPVPLAGLPTRSVLSQADLLVLHAGAQEAELEQIGLRGVRILRSFHPRFAAADLSRIPSAAEIAAERARQGNPGLSLLAFGAIRPYKGIDVALDALALVPRDLRVKLTVAGVFWDGGDELRAKVRALRLEDVVELRDGFVSNEDAARLFMAADASVLPYRSASQSGVVALSFAYGTPVIATAVGGLPEAIIDGVDGILCPPDNPAALARAIEELPAVHGRLARGVGVGQDRYSFARYAELLEEALDELSDDARVPVHERRGARRPAALTALQQVQDSQ